MSAPETYRFLDDGRFPNSPLPLIVYRGVLSPDPEQMERRFAASGWSNAWRNGIYAFHHFHSIAHEVLGIARGEVRVMFGGPAGQEVTIGAGDVVVSAAGVAHYSRGGSADLTVVGAYPGGMDWDLLKGDPAQHAAALRSIIAVPLPTSDPVLGPGQGLCKTWW